MEKSPSACDKTEAFESEFDPNENYQTGEKRSLKSMETDEASEKEGIPTTMEQFCDKFWTDFFDKVNESISVEELTKKYSVKNRRVYDLLGILEGLSFICKLKLKGTYMWIGVERNHYHYHFEEKKSVSLKDVAGLLKILLNNCRQGLTIKQLNQKIIHKIQETTKRQQCKLTINRRIYECLKVMKAFGMVEKEESLFKATVCKFKKPTNLPQSTKIERNIICTGSQMELKQKLQKSMSN